MKYKKKKKKKKNTHTIIISARWMENKLTNNLIIFFVFEKENKNKKIIEYIYIYISKKESLISYKKKNLLYISTFLYNINSTVNSFLSLLSKGVVSVRWPTESPPEFVLH